MAEFILIALAWAIVTTAFVVGTIIKFGVRRFIRVWRTHSPVIELRTIPKE